MYVLYTGCRPNVKTQSQKPWLTATLHYNCIVFNNSIIISINIIIGIRLLYEMQAESLKI